MPDSKRSSKGFQQIPESKTHTMTNPNDATIDIPLTGVTSRTGARRTGTFTSTHQQPTYPDQQMNEKAGLYKRPVAGRRKSARKTGHKGRDGEDDTMTRMGLIYNKILNFSIVTRYFLYIIPVGVILSIPIIIGATVAQKAAIDNVRIVWFFSWLLIVWVSLWVSKLAAKCLPAIFQFLCGIVSSGTRKYAMVITALELYLSLSGWALASLATFIPVMTRNPTQRANKDTARKHWQDVTNSVLAALLVSSLILLAEKLLVQLISIGYHRTQFNAKIKDSKHKINLLSLLYDASRSLFPAYCAEFAEEDYIINDSIEIGDGKDQDLGHRRTGSATPMKLLHNVGRFGDHITSAFGNIAQEVTGKQVFNPNSAHSIVVEALEKNKSSEALAKRLWMSFVVEGKEALYLEDIVEVLGSERQAEAEEAFYTLDRDGNGDISLDEMILTVCEFGRERHSIATSLHDVDQAINVLDNLLCTIIFVVCIFVFVAFLNSSFTTTLATAGTALLSLSFVFAGTAQEFLGSCIFLFVKHPFDVLDRVDINGDQLMVKHISLLFTVFKCVNNHKLTQVPNSVLNTLWIQNVSRSEAMREQLLIYVSFDTTLEDVQLLKNELHAFVHDKENSRDFQPDIDVELTGIAEMNKLELKVEIRHKSNWANETVRAARRSKFMCALVLALRKIPVNAPGGGAAALGSVDQPSYTVTVSDAQAATNRDTYKKTQDAKRLFPNEKTDPSPSSPTRAVSTAVESFNPHDSAAPPPLRSRHPPPSESSVLNTLNSRHPAADTAHHPSDLIEPTTPKSVARSVSMTEGEPDLDRTVSIEEVRGLLHRQSTRGKRKSPKASTISARLPQTSEKADPLPPLQASNPARLDYIQSPKFEYDPYMYVPPHQAGAPPQKEDSKPSQQRQQPQGPPRSYVQPTSDSPQAESPIIPPQHSSRAARELQDQQRPPIPQSSAEPRVAPPIALPTSSYQPIVPPKDTPPSSAMGYYPPPTALNTGVQAPTGATRPRGDTLSTMSPTEGSGVIHQDRGISPIRNPFQIHALKSQAQGANIPRAIPRPPGENAPAPHSSPPQTRVENQGPGPSSGQIRRPVPGNGNAFAKEAQGREREGEGVVPPPRGDSLSQP